MRIISGSLGGRVILAPDSKRTHPMSEKMRGAIFSALGDIAGLSVLDAYSGSGALGIEALSRGAAKATLIEADAGALKVIKSNIAELDLQESVQVVGMKVKAWAVSCSEEFDLILADPPYDKPDIPALALLTAHLKPGALMVLSWPGKSDLPQLERLRILKQRSFGDAQLGYYRAADGFLK